jgi:N-methylhydantoinase A
MGYRLGIDVGGTFTDLALLDGASGRLVVGKVPSVPGDPSEGILHGITRILADAGVTPEEVVYLAHGTTVSTNTLLQRKGAKTGLVTTRGFRDLLEIARQRRPSLYDLHAPKPAPLVDRALRAEVPERVMADGRVRTPLDLDAVDRALEGLATAGIEALAICFLYAYLEPDHERQVLARARQRLPGVFCAASHEVLPEFREYERLSTTVANAYLGPAMARYIQAFRRRVRELGIRSVPYINHRDRRGRPGPREDRAVRAERRRGRGRVARRAARRAVGGHVRHGRHQHRRVLRAGRHADLRLRARDRGGADPDPGSGHPHDRGRRRQHRVA